MRYLIPKPLPFDTRSFVLGLCVVLGIYVCFLLYVFAFGDSIIKAMEDKMSSHTTKIEMVEEKKSSVAKTSATGTQKSPPPVVFEDLSEHTDAGYLPIIREKDGLSSFEAYKTKFPIQEGITKPVVAFIVTNYALSNDNSEMMLQLLPPEVSFILSPFSTMPEEWVSLAREKKHEAWINLSLENESTQHSDTGPATLLTHASFATNLKSYHWTLAKANAYVGVAAYSDNIFTEAKDGQLARILEENFTRGLGYLEINPRAPSSVISATALRSNGPYIRTDMEIIRMQGKNSFEEFEGLAKKQKFAVAIIPGYPENIKRLAVWLQKVAQSDYIVAPVSAMYDIPLYATPSSTLNKSDMVAPEGVPVP